MSGLWHTVDHLLPLLVVMHKFTADIVQGIDRDTKDDLVEILPCHKLEGAVVLPIIPRGLQVYL